MSDTIRTPASDGDAAPTAPSAGDLLVEAIADAVARKLERMSGMQQRLMDIHDAARYLGMTEPALRQKAGVELPCVRLDGKLRFDRRELDRYIDRAPRGGV
jgi:Helix-turn-helix domain